MATFWDIYFAIRAAERASKIDAANAGKTRAEIKAARKAAAKAKQERREKQVEAWGTKIAASLNRTTDKIRANNEYWYKRLGIKRKPKK